MATIPTYDEWMKSTALGFLKTRSKEMEGVDRALKRYELERNGTALEALFVAWNAWKRTKPDWRASERNKGGILERLDAGIKERLGPNMKGGTLTPAEKAAYAEIERARREAFRRLFVGKQVKLKGLQSAVEAKKAFQELGKGAKGIYDVAAPGVKAGAGAGSSAVGQAIDSMIGNFFDEANAAIIKPVLLNTFGGDVVAAMIPVVGQITGAAGVLMSWGKVAKSKYDQVKTEARRPFIGGKGTDAEQAFNGLRRLLDDSIRSNAIAAATKTTAYTARSLLTLADGGAISGPVIGAAEAVAKVTQKLYEVGSEYKETKRANTLLQQNVLDFRLVQAYPLLGCYMLTCSSTSDVVNMARVEFGGALWMDDVEWMVKTHVAPVREKARGYIDSSLFHVPGLSPLVKSSKLDLVGKIKGATAG